MAFLARTLRRLPRHFRSFTSTGADPDEEPVEVKKPKKEKRNSWESSDETTNYSSEDPEMSMFTDDEGFREFAKLAPEKLFFPYEPDEKLDVSDFRRPLPDNLHLKWVRFNRELNDYVVTDLVSEDLKQMRVFLVSFVAAFQDDCITQLHDWAKGAIEMRTTCFMHDIMCVSVHDPYVICEFARMLGYEDRISFIADWDSSMTKWLRNEVQTEYSGLKSFRSAGVMTKGLLRIKFSSGLWPLMYSYAVSPNYMWKHCYHEELKIRLFS
jgi:peroxiredoxin